MDIDIQVLIKAAHAGGEVLNRYFGQVLETHIKRDASDYRTKADVESEAAILAVIESAHPEVTIHSEERGITDKKSDYTVVVDPLDGTNNFVLGMPYFSVSIGVLKQKRIVAGVIYNPITGQTYHAVRGGGALLDGESISVSQEDSLARSTIAYSQGYENDESVKIKMMDAMRTAGAKRVCNFWSPNLDFCLLANGRIESVIFNEAEIYDHIPGKLIAKEAGAIVTDAEGGEESDETNSLFVASNCAAVHNSVLDIFNGARHSS